MRAVDRSSVMRSTLSLPAKGLWSLLEALADPDGSNVFYSIRKLCLLAKCSENTLAKYLDELESAGYAKGQRRHRKSTVWKLAGVSKFEVKVYQSLVVLPSPITPPCKTRPKKHPNHIKVFGPVNLKGCDHKKPLEA